MIKTPNWGAFYTALGELAPKFLLGVHATLIAYVEEESKNSDAFWSESLEATLVGIWSENPGDAVKETTLQWASNVRSYLNEILGPYSLIPFEEMGISDNLREKLRGETKRIEIRLDDVLISALLKAAAGQDDEVEAVTRILVQAIVEPYATTSEGQLIRALAVPWKLIVDHLERDWTEAFRIPPRSWEEMIAAAFDQEGYDEVTLTPRSGDHGRDVIAVRKGVGSVRIIGSVKAYGPGHRVRYDDVRALAGVLLGDPKASKGIITTTSEFAPGILRDPVLAPLIPYRLELMNGSDLKTWLKTLASQPK
jgi:restriction system protein